MSEEKKELKENVHVTWLGMYNSCPYNFKNGSGPILPEYTYKWDLLNIAVTSQWDYKPFLERHKANLEKDFRSLEILEEVFAKAKEMIARLKEKHKQVRQETKMMYKYSDEYNIVGTPDLIYYDEEQDLYCIRDWKMSTHSWYGNPEVTAYDMQPALYAVFVMEYFNVEKVSFAFRCFDKKNWKLWEFGAKEWETGPAIYTRDEVMKKMHDVMWRYIAARERDIREPHRNKKCGFCKLKQNGTCPMYKKAVTTVESSEDFF